jgi:hypothetical protein
LTTTSSQRLSILFPASHFLRIDFAPRSFSLTFRSSPDRHILFQRCPIVFDELHFLRTATRKSFQTSEKTEDTTQVRRSW